MTLEELRDFEQELVEDMEASAMLLVEVRAEIARLSAEESQNEFWSDPDTDGGRTLLPMMDVQAILLDGNRAEVYHAQTNEVFTHRFFATITEDVTPAATAHYARAATAYFGILISRAGYGRGPIHAECFDLETNVRIPGLYIPYYGSYGEHGSTVALREYWQSPQCIGRIRYIAEFQMKQLDRQYRMAQFRGQTEEFMAEYPYYVPE